MAKFDSVAGGWLGTYAYKGRVSRQPPVRFEATFTAGEIPGSFTGIILDDGSLGDASVTGTQTGRVVRFTKIYLRSSGYGDTGPVAYEGTLSEDGVLLTGTWRLSLPGHSDITGVWDARRMWHEAQETIQVEEEAEALAVAPSGRPMPRYGGFDR